MADGNNTKNISEYMSEEQPGCCHQKSTPRGQEGLKLMKNRLNRITGQLNGIGKMLDEKIGRASCRERVFWWV